MAWGRPSDSDIWRRIGDGVGLPTVKTWGAGLSVTSAGLNGTKSVPWCVFRTIVNTWIGPS
jgi:hypothetical protein